MSSGRSSGRRKARGPSSAREAALKYEAPPRGFGVDDRLAWLVKMLGNNRVAELLGVSASQPSRWRSGKEGISAESRLRIIDLDYVVIRLRQFMPTDQLDEWLSSFNHHLRTRPIDALRYDGIEGVLVALDAEEFFLPI